MHSHREDDTTAGSEVPSQSPLGSTSFERASQEIERASQELLLPGRRAGACPGLPAACPPLEEASIPCADTQQPSGSGTRLADAAGAVPGAGVHASAELQQAAVVQAPAGPNQDGRRPLTSRQAPDAPVWVGRSQARQHDSGVIGVTVQPEQALRQDEAAGGKEAAVPEQPATLEVSCQSSQARAKTGNAVRAEAVFDDEDDGDAWDADLAQLLDSAAALREPPPPQPILAVGERPAHDRDAQVAGPSGRSFTDAAAAPKPFAPALRSEPAPSLCPQVCQDTKSIKHSFLVIL